MPSYVWVSRRTCSFSYSGHVASGGCASNMTFQKFGNFKKYTCMKRIIDKNVGGVLMKTKQQEVGEAAMQS